MVNDRFAHIGLIHVVRVSVLFFAFKSARLSCIATVMKSQLHIFSYIDSSVINLFSLLLMILVLKKEYSYVRDMINLEHGQRIINFTICHCLLFICLLFPYKQCKCKYARDKLYFVL